MPRIRDLVLGRVGTVTAVWPGRGIDVMWKPGQVTFVSAEKVNSGRYEQAPPAGLS
jgi:microcompartment protein CcmL/EutN